MTGLVRKATLLGVCGLLAASSAFAFVPDPAQSTVPSWIFAVGFVSGPTPDTDGANGPAGTSNIIIIKDFAGNPIAGVGVHIKFPCDIRLCQAVVAGQTVACATNTLDGVTNAAGQFVFTAIGASDDAGLVIPPAVFRGGALNSTIITVDGYVGTFKTTNTVAFDQNGGTGSAGTNGVSFGDVAVNLILVGAYNLNPANYKPRGDQNCDQSLSFADLGVLVTQVGRIGLLGGQGCTSTFCAKVPANCP